MQLSYVHCEYGQSFGDNGKCEKEVLITLHKDCIPPSFKSFDSFFSMDDQFFISFMRNVVALIEKKFRIQHYHLAVVNAKQIGVNLEKDENDLEKEFGVENKDANDPLKDDLKKCMKCFQLARGSTYIEFNSFKKNVTQKSLTNFLKSALKSRFLIYVYSDLRRTKEPSDSGSKALLNAEADLKYDRGKGQVVHIPNLKMKDLDVISLPIRFTIYTILTQCSLRSLIAME